MALRVRASQTFHDDPFTSFNCYPQTRAETFGLFYLCTGPGKLADALPTVDAHAAALIHRLVDIAQLELVPLDLIWWTGATFKNPMWQQISKGDGTMDWVGRESLVEKTYEPKADADKVSKFGAIGSGRTDEGKLLHRNTDDPSDYEVLGSSGLLEGSVGCK